MAGYIVDTDVCIDFLKGLDYSKELLGQLFEEKVFISILSVYELLKGAYTDRQERVVKEFVEAFEVINIDKGIIERGAEFYRKYRKKGITLSDIDCLIMATAKEKDLLIVTRNVRHYPETDLLSEFSKRFILKDRVIR